MAQVVWTYGAAADLEAIRAYIGEFSPLASKRMATRLIQAAYSLEWSPERGRVISRGRRELAAVSPYLIRYAISGEQVFLLQIRHGARAPD